MNKKRFHFTFTGREIAKKKERERESMEKTTKKTEKALEYVALIQSRTEASLFPRSQ
jgi:hypothetical protein